jgi:hypothetical protein
MSGQKSIAKEALHLGRAAEAKGLGKPDEGGRLHSAAFRDYGERLQREIVRMFEHISRRLLVPFAQGVISRHDLRPQFVSRRCN